MQGGGRYLELLLQLDLELLHARGQHKPGGQAGGVSQQHGVGAIEELVAEKFIVLPALVNFLCGIEGGVSLVPFSTLLQALPEGNRHSGSLCPALLNLELSQR